MLTEIIAEGHAMFMKVCHFQHDKQFDAFAKQESKEL